LQKNVVVLNTTDALFSFSGVNGSTQIDVERPSINVDHQRVLKTTTSNIQNLNTKIPSEKHVYSS